MANEEYEVILRPTETPSRVGVKEGFKARVAKLTGRTITALKEKIKGKRLSIAYNRYNANYNKMAKSLIKADQLRAAYENGEGVTQSQVLAAYDAVARYDKKLSKYAVKLLTDDIKQAASTAKPKPIRVPRILLGKLKPITSAVLRILDEKKKKRHQKSLVKEMKGATRDFMESSLDSAIFSDAKTGTLREKVDADAIKGFLPNRDAVTFEDKISNLKRFISSNGKTPLYGEDEIGSKNNPGANLPPVAPVATEESETPQFSLDDLKKNLVNSRVSQPENAEEKVATPVVTNEELGKGIGTKTSDASDVVETEPTIETTHEELNSEDQKAIARFQRTTDSLNSLLISIQNLEQQLENISSPETKRMIQAYITDLNAQLHNIVERTKGQSSGATALSEEDTTLTPVVQPVSETVPVAKKVTSVSEVPEVEEETIEQPAVTIDGEGATPESPKTNSDSTIAITNSDNLGRVSQSGEPSTLVVTPSVLAEMQKRNEAAKARIASLTTEIENLRAQKALYKEYIEVASATRDNERAANELQATRDVESAETEQLASQAAAIGAEVGSKFVQKR